MKLKSFRLEKQHIPFVVLGIAVLVLVMFSAILIPGRQIKTAAQLPDAVSGKSDSLATAGIKQFLTWTPTSPGNYAISISPPTIPVGGSIAIAYSGPRGSFYQREWRIYQLHYGGNFGSPIYTDSGSTSKPIYTNDPGTWRAEYRGQMYRGGTWQTLASTTFRVTGNSTPTPTCIPCPTCPLCPMPSPC